MTTPRVLQLTVIAGSLLLGGGSFEAVLANHPSSGAEEVKAMDSDGDGFSGS